MTKVIAVLIIVVFLYGGWLLWLRWDKVRNEEETTKKQAVAATVIPEGLPGMPSQSSSQLENSLRAAKDQGPAAFKNWLKTYGRMIQDPRKAWIDLDYVVAISRDDPSEARRIFAEVKSRTPPSSPVYPRIKQLEKTYE